MFSRTARRRPGWLVQSKLGEGEGTRQEGRGELPWTESSRSLARLWFSFFPKDPLQDFAQRSAWRDLTANDPGMRPARGTGKTWWRKTGWEARGLLLGPGRWGGKSGQVLKYAESRDPRLADR